MKKIFFIIFIMFFCYVYGEEYGTLKININKVLKNKGNVMVAIYNSKKNFGKDGKTVTSASIKVQNDEEISYIFDKLPYGEYAVLVFYDENSNGQLDTGLFGIPKEPVGASNNNLNGPPSFDSSKFVLDKDYKEIEIKLKKLF